ncbi:ABC transporter permease [Gordonia rhizosphera]|uniref:Putative ABC transporter permease protein n=1 Tax=Gordonia rhizosphera NBRC 16068 TaxID=1108045 RepID=K6V1G1_9ACTN|nr:ABC transporter permease [Gordonia rhizosphera]GAB89758.1 putative ABC transporter permease protein [Gordonia rhizosphera NBRC 16068]
MLSYILAGLALGSIYAIAAGSMVITFVASGIFNLAFAAMAFSVARCYYFLHTEQGWSILPAAVVSLGIFAPLLGVTLYLLLFRHLRLRSMLIKLVATIGLSVALPPLVSMVFGRLVNVTAPGLAPRPLAVFHLFGATITGDQLAIYLGLIVVVVVGGGLLRFTDVGMKVRALVDSEAMTSLSGISPGRVSIGVWAASAVLAGLAGILIAPTAGLSAEAMTGLMATAFAAVVAARLRSVPVAIAAALLMGLATGVIQKFIDPESAFAAKAIPSVPFVLMFGFLLYHAFRGQAGDVVAGGGLDRAISTNGNDPTTAPRSQSRTRPYLRPSLIAATITIAVVALLPLTMTTYWTGLATAGICCAIALLSYTLVVGEGGMVWLSQITFAGMGAVLSAELATNHGWSPLLAVFVAALVVTPVGILLGLLTIRLGDLYVALVTLSFGLLITTLVFTQDTLYNYGTGVTMARPDFAAGPQTFAYLALGVFLVFGLLITNLRRSTTGLAVGAVRWSENGSRTLGLSVVQVKVMLTALATFVAAVGGGFLAMNFGSTLPDSFNPFIGMVWLAVLVTLGSRSIIAALVAGLLIYLMPGFFSSYLPSDLADVPTILFGLGAIGVARNPQGVIAQTGRDLGRLVARFRRPDALAPEADSVETTSPPGDSEHTPEIPIARRADEINVGGHV